MSHRSAVGAVVIYMSWCYANWVPVQLGHALHGTVHESMHPEALFLGSQSLSECVIKVAHAQHEERALLHKHRNWVNTKCTHMQSEWRGIIMIHGVRPMNWISDCTDT